VPFKHQASKQTNVFMAMQGVTVWTSELGQSCLPPTDCTSVSTFNMPETVTQTTTSSNTNVFVCYSLQTIVVIITGVLVDMTLSTLCT